MRSCDLNYLKTGFPKKQFLKDMGFENGLGGWPCMAM